MRISSKVVEGTRCYYTRSLPERLHFRLKKLAVERRLPLEQIVNLALERGANQIERELRRRRANLN
jgi:hypothetical protein